MNQEIHEYWVVSSVHEITRHCTKGPIKNKMAPSNQSQVTILAHQIHKKMQNGPFLKFLNENTA